MNRRRAGLLGLVLGVLLTSTTGCGGGGDDVVHNPEVTAEARVLIEDLIPELAGSDPKAAQEWKQSLHSLKGVNTSVTPELAQELETDKFLDQIREAAPELADPACQAWELGKPDTADLSSDQLLKQMRSNANQGGFNVGQAITATCNFKEFADKVKQL